MVRLARAVAWVVVTSALAVGCTSSSGAATDAAHSAAVSAGTEATARCALSLKVRPLIGPLQSANTEYHQGDRDATIGDATSIVAQIDEARAAPPSPLPTDAFYALTEAVAVQVRVAAEAMIGGSPNQDVGSAVHDAVAIVPLLDEYARGSAQHPGYCPAGVP